METPPVGMESMDEESLIKHLRDYLQHKRYVVVFDDIWKIDFCEGIKHAILDNGKGCRIMITTCKWEVVNFCKKIFSCLCSSVKTTTSRGGMGALLQKSISI